MYRDWRLLVQGDAEFSLTEVNKSHVVSHEDTSIFTLDRTQKQDSGDMLIATSAIGFFIFLLLITNGGRVSVAYGSLAIGLIAFFGYLYQHCWQRTTRCDLDPRSQRRSSSLLKH